jgi:hypothetical protein
MTVVSLPTLDDLTRYVRTTLCDRDALDPGQTPFCRTPVVRNGRPWGYSFHVEGPRLLKSAAVWAADAGTIGFYDSNGQKVLDVRLSESPELPDIRAHRQKDPAVRSPRLKRKSA